MDAAWPTSAEAQGITGELVSLAALSAYAAVPLTSATESQLQSALDTAVSLVEGFDGITCRYFRSGTVEAKWRGVGLTKRWPGKVWLPGGATGHSPSEVSLRTLDAVTTPVVIASGPVREGRRWVQAVDWTGSGDSDEVLSMTYNVGGVAAPPPVERAVLVLASSLFFNRGGDDGTAHRTASALCRPWIDNAGFRRRLG